TPQGTQNLVAEIGILGAFAREERVPLAGGQQPGAGEQIVDELTAHGATGYGSVIHGSPLGLSRSKSQPRANFQSRSTGLCELPIAAPTSASVMPRKKRKSTTRRALWFNRARSSRASRRSARDMSSMVARWSRAASRGFRRLRPSLLWAFRLRSWSMST